MSLQKGTLNWIMVAAIGVSIVVAGQFSGWNFGMANGWQNMLIAFGIMFVFYAGLMQCLSEMAATWPSAGGLSSYVRLAFGEWAGALIGIATGLALISCTGVVSVFIVGYAAPILPINETLFKILLFMTVVVLNLRGAKDLFSITLIAGFIAVLTLLSFSASTVSDFQASNLELSTSSISLLGIVAAIPFALWMFVGIEHTVVTSEETKNPQKDIPRGLTCALLTLALTGILLLFTAPGAAGVSTLTDVVDPLLASIPASSVVLKNFIMIGVLFGLLAGFFSITYSASRQLFDVARAGFLVSPIAQVNKRGTPLYSVLTVAALGFGLSLMNPERVMLGVVVMFTFTYVLTTAAYIFLKKNKTDVTRPYQAIGGMGLGVIMFVASVLLFISSFKFDVVVLAPLVVLFVIAIVKLLSKKANKNNSIAYNENSVEHLK
ncbi:amino acid permease [Acinetobacter haemolyticus]|jgi:ethanolamine permease|uniref:amino acid permease n=1 Tax=Acinetobacter TaxID=469 RepID=UPI00124F8A9C|nr:MULTISPECIES: amino acid permease [Acinetobacter]NAR48535.1 amino acid permease [Acinetobacter haemolyticus]